MQEASSARQVEPFWEHWSDIELEYILESIGATAAFLKVSAVRQEVDYRDAKQNENRIRRRNIQKLRMSWCQVTLKKEM